MKRNIISSLAATFITAAVTLGSFTACSDEEIVANQQTATKAKTYTINITASMGEDNQTRAVAFGNDGSTITSTFNVGDLVYVYNETQGAFACESDGTPIALTLTAGDIKNEGKSCTLSGNLTFYKDDGTDPYNPHFVAVNPGENDTYSFFYNMSYVYCDYPEASSYDFIDQDGSATKASACDYAMKSGVTMTASGNALAPSATVTFQSLQSMFRQRLSFTKGPNGEGSTSPTIKHLNVNTKNSTLAGGFSPLRQLGVYYTSKYDVYDMDIDDPVITSDGDIYLSMAFDYGEGHEAAGDKLQLEAIDTEGHVYVASKAVPTGGFTIGKYYHGAMTLAWSEQRYIKPTVTPSVSPSSTYQYNINGGGAALAYTISGTSKGYNFHITNYSSCTLTLSSLNAEYDQGGYIGSGSAGLNLVVNGANTLNCPNGQLAAGYDYGNLKLSGNGTLTITTNSANFCGLKGANYTSSNNNNSTTTSVDVTSLLAADDYLVTRSARTDNSDGTYTWTYTVTPKPAYLSATTSDIGKVIGANGNIYNNCAAANTAGTTAMAIIAYVGSDTGESGYTHGLALALKNANHGNSCKWKTSNTNDDQTEYTDISLAVAAKESGLTLSTGKNSSTYPAFQAALNNTITPDEGLISAAAPLGSSGWFLPSIFQWNKIINGLSGNTDVLSESSNDNLKYTVANQKLDAANGYAINPFIWSSTEYDWNGNSRAAIYIGSYGRGTYSQKTEANYVRAAFAF